MNAAAKEIVRADGEDDRVCAGDLIAHALLFEAGHEIGSLRTVDAEIHRVDVFDAVCSQFFFETAGNSFAGFVAGTVSEGVSE